MTRYRKAFATLIQMMLCAGAFAQNNTNSPYTRYGYGQLADQGPGNSKAMGGIAYGLRDKSQVNFANPASYSTVDSLTFIFDGGISLQNTNFSNGTLKRNAKNSGFDYITMEFRAARWMGISLGMLPFSSVGYKMGESRDMEQESYSVSYSGEGGLHQIYFGTGLKIFKNLSVGANISYLWGDITHSVSVTYPNTTLAFTYQHEQKMSEASYKLDLGMQYTHSFGKKHQVTAGVVLSPGHNLSNDAYTQTTTGNNTMGYTVSQRDTVATCGIPTTLGIGFAYVYDGRLTAGADMTLQNWGKTTFMDNRNAFCNSCRISLGAEYLPAPTGRSYLSVVKYRLGAYYSRPYYKIEGKRAADEYGVTAGFGLPIPRARSVLSVSGQYVRVSGKHAGLLDENTFRVCIGITFNERWFFKRKVD